MKTALITRPKPEAIKLKKKLSQIDVKGVVEPLLEITFSKTSKSQFKKIVERYNVQAIVLTSNNGAKALGKISKDYSLRVITVGDTTADEAREQGFYKVSSVDGDLIRLKRFIINNLDPEKGVIIYLSGNIISEDLGHNLGRNGFKVKRIIGYKASYAKKLSNKAVELLKNGKINYILFYSSKTSEVFLELIKYNNLPLTLRKIDVFCLSENIARIAKKISWKSINIAKEPTEKSLLELINKFHYSGTPKS